MYETRLSRMIMQLPPAQMANRDGDAGMETMLWDINIIPNELDNGYLMLPPGVLHMSALGRFGRFTLFSPRVSHSKHLPVFCFVLCFGFGGVCCFVVFLFPVLQVFGIPNSPRSLDLDDRQGFIASSAMQQKKKIIRSKVALVGGNFICDIGEGGCGPEHRLSVTLKVDEDVKKRQARVAPS